MAASMLDVKAILHGQLFVRRNVCKLCSRNFSSEKQSSEIKTELDNVKPAYLLPHAKRNDWKHNPLRDIKGPLWEAAWEKLEIKQPNVKVPTVNHRGVELPCKVKRDSTTILKAIAETTKMENANASYSMIDDVSLHLARFRLDNFSAKEDGRQTARYMMSKYQTAFTQFEAHPNIPAFNPVQSGYDDTSVSVNALEERIRKRKVTHALEIYDRLEEEGDEVPIAVEEKLLELLCVFNGEDPQDKLPFIDNKDNKEETPEIVWKADTADKIFNKHVDAGTATPFMYNVYVCGLAKYSKYDNPMAEKAVKLYTKMKEDSIPVYLCTYNSMFKYYSSNTPESIFESMKKDGLVPNTQTFKCALYYGRGHAFKKTLGEMKLAGLDHDFETMFLIFRAFDNGIDFFEDLVDYMAEQKTWYLDHPGQNILVQMMRALRSINSPEGVRVAKKLFKLWKDMGMRYKTMDCRYSDGLVHSYFNLMLDSGSFSDFIETYKDAIPTYQSTMSVRQINQILDRFDRERPEGDFLINLYEDVFNFLKNRLQGMDKKMTNIDLIFQVMLADYHSLKLRKQFAEVAHTFFTEFIQQQLIGLRNSGDKKKLLNFPPVLTSLDLMLKEPSYLDKTWECYMAYAEESNKFLRKQTLSWEKMIKHLVEVEDTGKIRQFLRKIKVSSRWANHSFLNDMREDLNRILELEDRATLEYILDGEHDHRTADFLGFQSEDD